MSDAELLLLAESRKKSGWAAAFLNLLLPGAGYMYCGTWILGILAFLFTVAVAVTSMGAGLLIMYPILFIDGFLSAGRANKKMIEKLLKDRAALQPVQAAA